MTDCLVRLVPGHVASKVTGISAKNKLGYETEDIRWYAVLVPVHMVTILTGFAEGAGRCQAGPSDTGKEHSCPDRLGSVVC